MEEMSQRQLALLKIITAKKVCTVRDLADRLKLSRETIRKELLSLLDAGLIIRKQGKILFQDTQKNAQLLESSGVLSKEQRRQHILQILKQDKEVRITVLANKLKVSVLTIRSDIAALELAGKVLKKHGSATLFEPSIPTNAELHNGFGTRTSMLGQHTIMHVKPEETIFLDGGEVSRFVAASLPPYTNLFIWTNSMEILDTLRQRSYAYPVHVTGNRVALNDQRFCLPQGQTLISSPGIDKAFICCSSYAANTFYLAEGEDLPTITEVCERAEKIYIILDSSHLDISGKKPFPYKKYLSKIQEVLIDDGIGSFRANVLFTRQDPLIICGPDYTYRNVRKYQHRIGFLVNKDRNYFFVQAVHNSLLEATAACKSVSLVIRECSGDYASTVETLNLLLDEQVDLIIDYSLCMESLMYIGEKCLSRNVKLISVDYMAPGAIYFGADNAKAGTIAGEQASRYIHNHWQSKLDHLLVLAKYGYEPITKLRISSALEQIEKSITTLPDSVHTIEWGHPQKDPTQELVKLLKETPKEENMLILAFNLRHLLSSHDLILQYRECENTIIVGHNYTKQIEELMKIGKSPILGCVHYNPEEYGEKIMDIALHLLEGGDVQLRNYTNLTWIEKTQ
jgi:ribose transport system substrate-binding protein